MINKVSEGESDEGRADISLREIDGCGVRYALVSSPSLPPNKVVPGHAGEASTQLPVSPSDVKEIQCVLAVISFSCLPFYCLRSYRTPNSMSPCHLAARILWVQLRAEPSVNNKGKSFSSRDRTRVTVSLL